MDNYLYHPFIDNSLLRRALPRPAAQPGAASSTAPLRGLRAHSSRAMLLSRPKNHQRRKYTMFDCRGDFRKDEAALSYGVDHGFRQGPKFSVGN